MTRDSYPSQINHYTYVPLKPLERRMLCTRFLKAQWVALAKLKPLKQKRVLEGGENQTKDDNAQ